MNLNGFNKAIIGRISIISMVCALTTTAVNAGTMGPAQVAAPGKIYFGVFGGGGTSNNVSVDQYATAFFPEISGGPLAVNSFGHADDRSVGIIGGQVGFQWPEIILEALSSPSSLSPVFELEGYYLGNSSFSGHVINNDVTRLPEHDFLVTYPMSAGVFLTNAVLNLNSPNYNRWHPYVGAGIGAAVLSISNADSLQLSPVEPNVNHYNSNTDDTVATFAAQVKVGLNYDINPHFGLFAEYRGLYMADSKFTFGSTVYPARTTSIWLANFGHQYYNMGAAGLRVMV